jgi:SAM-dependent methyltransferase
MGYLTDLYRATMADAYGFARRIISATSGRVLDSGAGHGQDFQPLRELGFSGDLVGIEWSADEVDKARADGLAVVQGDLNKPLPFEAATFDCVYGLSVLEHILNPCAYIREAHRVLKPGGKLVLLTPNIATYFTALNILRGRMPSSGPHPDSNALVALNDYGLTAATERTSEGETPTHRHLIVFSYSALRNYLRMAGFSHVEGRGFGYYPFPRPLQSALQRLDPWHCHQMVFVATK